MTKEQFINKYGLEAYQAKRKYQRDYKRNTYNPTHRSELREYSRNYYQNNKELIRERNKEYFRNYYLKSQKSAGEYLKWFYSNENYNGYQEIHTHFQHPQLGILLSLDPITKLATKNYKADHCNCEICGKPTECVHHVIPKAQYYKDLKELTNLSHFDILRKINSDTNLMALCKECHKLIHRGELNDDEL